MANILRLKRRAAGGATGAPSALASAEPAYNEQDDVLYYGKGDNGSAGATSIIPIGGKGAFADLNSTQTVGGAKTFSVSPSVPTPTLTDSSGNAASTAFVQGQFPSITGGTGTKLSYNAKGLITGASALLAADIPTLTTGKLSDFATAVAAFRLDQFAAPTAPVAFGGQRATGLADPTGAQDAATKNYVDGLSQGLDIKQSVKAATTANITLSGTQTIDGIALAAGDRCLVKNQTTASQNGLYVVAAGSWTRTSDMDVWGEVPGAFVFVESGGTANGSTGWTTTVASGGTINTTAVSWTQFSGAGTFLAGAGLSLVGSTFSISASYGGQTSIVTLGTVTTGTWQGTAVALGFGGTGASLTGAATGALIKKTSSTALGPATAGTDYLDPSSSIDGGTF